MRSCCSHTGKTRRELVELEHSINEQLDSGAVPDPEYWTAVLGRLGIWQVWTLGLPATRIYDEALHCCSARVHLHSDCQPMLQGVPTGENVMPF